MGYECADSGAAGQKGKMSVNLLCILLGNFLTVSTAIRSLGDWVARIQERQEMLSGERVTILEKLRD